MKRQRRIRRHRRRGVQHVSDLLSVLMNEIESDEPQQRTTASAPVREVVPITNAVPANPGFDQATFAFYESGV